MSGDDETGTKLLACLCGGCPTSRCRSIFRSAPHCLPPHHQLHEVGYRHQFCPACLHPFGSLVVVGGNREKGWHGSRVSSHLIGGVDGVCLVVFAAWCKPSGSGTRRTSDWQTRTGRRMRHAARDPLITNDTRSRGTAANRGMASTKGKDSWENGGWVGRQRGNP